MAITAENSPLTDLPFLKTFNFNPFIGGRFSTTSEIGLLPLGLCFGSHLIDPFLNGAFLQDQQALTNTEKNIAFKIAKININYRQKLNLNSLALVPYGESLSEFSNFICQLISESLGKGITIDNTAPQIPAPTIINGNGPEAQHTFFQHIHQSPIPTPVEFIYAVPTYNNQYHMLQQIIGQMISLNKEVISDNKNQSFTGNRPSILVYLKKEIRSSIG